MKKEAKIKTELSETEIPIANQVEFLYRYNGHGWSLFDLFVDRQQNVFFMTHIFNNPFDEIVSAAVSVLQNEENVAFH
jgi:hypothetical protein